MGSNIFLVGSRGAGKTTVGKAVAQKLAMDFLDMDRLIVHRQGRTIQEIVAQDGWPSFREMEGQLLTELIKREKTVIATGGGAILHEEIWPRVMASGLVVWLQADIASVQARLQGDRSTGSQRPPLNGNDAIAEVEETMRSRAPLYIKGSHLTVDAGQSVQNIAEFIIKRVTPNRG